MFEFNNGLIFQRKLLNKYIAAQVVYMAYKSTNN